MRPRSTWLPDQSLAHIHARDISARHPRADFAGETSRAPAPKRVFVFINHIYIHTYIVFYVVITTIIAPAEYLWNYILLLLLLCPIHRRDLLTVRVVYALSDDSLRLWFTYEISERTVRAHTRRRCRAAYARVLTGGFNGGIFPGKLKKKKFFIESLVAKIDFRPTLSFTARVSVREYPSHLAISPTSVFLAVFLFLPSFRYVGYDL